MPNLNPLASEKLSDLINSVINPRIQERLKQYTLLMRMDRPIGSLLLGWPVMWALWLASDGSPDWGLVVIFILGVFVMRSAGCVINDFADRDIDPHVARTRDRPIAAGRVSPKEALGLFLVLCLIALGLVLLLNRLALYISLAAVVSAASYPFMKRYTYIPQAFLGLAFAWAIPMVWAAHTGEVPKVSWLLFIVVILWALAYDTMYAMADREDDLKIGVKSTAILFGEMDRLMVGIFQISVLAGLWMLGRQLSLSIVYDIGLGVAALFSVYHQYLIRNREPLPCFEAFRHNNWFGMAVFGGIVGHYLVAG